MHNADGTYGNWASKHRGPLLHTADCHDPYPIVTLDPEPCANPQSKLQSKLLQGGLYGSMRGVLNGDTRSLDYGSSRLRVLRSATFKRS